MTSTPYRPRRGRAGCAVVHQPAGARGSLPGRESTAVRPPLAGRDDKPERATPAFPGKVDLACEPASRASQGLIGTVTRRALAPTRDLRGTRGGASRVLMSAAGRGIDADHAPVDPALGIGVGLDGPQDSLPRTVRRPPAMTVVARLPVAEVGRQVPPGKAGPLPEQNPVDHPTVALPASTPPVIRRQARLQPSPLSSERSPRSMSHGTSSQQECHTTRRTAPSHRLRTTPASARRTGSPGVPRGR